MRESKRVRINYGGNIYTAYVRYHDDGDQDVEIEGDDVQPEIYDYAWDFLEAKGYLIEDGYYGDGYDDDGDFGDCA